MRICLGRAPAVTERLLTSTCRSLSHSRRCRLLPTLQGSLRWRLSRIRAQVVAAWERRLHAPRFHVASGPRALLRASCIDVCFWHARANWHCFWDGRANWHCFCVGMARRCWGNLLRDKSGPGRGAGPRTIELYYSSLTNWKCGNENTPQGPQDTDFFLKQQ